MSIQKPNIPGTRIYLKQNPSHRNYSIPTRIIIKIINRRLSSNTLSFCVIGLGIWSVLTLPLAEKPLVELGKGTITTSYPGASAEDIEVNINSKLDMDMRDLEHIIKLEPEQIRRYGLTLAQVADAVTNNSILSTGGSLERIGSEELKTPGLIGEVILSKNPKIKLSDVTRNNENHCLFVIERGTINRILPKNLGRG